MDKVGISIFNFFAKGKPPKGKQMNLPIPITVPNNTFCIKFNNDQEKKELAELFIQWLGTNENTHYSRLWTFKHKYITTETTAKITDWWYTSTKYQEICFNFTEGKQVLLQLIANKQPVETHTIVETPVPIVEDSTPTKPLPKTSPEETFIFSPLKEYTMRKHFVYNHDHGHYDGVASMDVTFERRVAKQIAKMIWWPTKRLGLIGIKTGRRAAEIGVAAAMIFGGVKLAQTETGQQVVSWAVATVQTLLQNPTIS